MSGFKREVKYWVTKLSDVNAALTPQEIEQLDRLLGKVETHRLNSGKTPLKCVVIENDSPVYELAYQALENEANTNSQ